jgi:hypothetical protein
MREERMFYWRDRLKPAMFPEDWLTLITDGAAQKWYIVPRSPGTDLSRNACQLKDRDARSLARARHPHRAPAPARYMLLSHGRILIRVNHISPSNQDVAYGSDCF